MEATIVSGHALARAYESIPFDMVTLTILHGARRMCCDEAAVIIEGGQTIAIATIAPNGEENDGHPTIVGIWVARDHRGRGFGKSVVLAALRRCKDRGFTPVHLDLLSTGIARLIDALPEDMQTLVRIRITTDILDLFVGMGY